MKYHVLIILLIVQTSIFYSCETENNEIPLTEVKSKSLSQFNIRFGSEIYVPSNNPGGVNGFYAINTVTRDIYYSERIVTFFTINIL